VDGIRELGPISTSAIGIQYLEEGDCLDRDPDEIPEADWQSDSCTALMLTVRRPRSTRYNSSGDLRGKAARETAGRIKI
jgi:hypothetical protein